MNTLDNLQTRWRKGCEVLSNQKCTYGEVDVLVISEGHGGDNEYMVLRYFPIGEGWEVSADYTGPSIGEVLKEQSKAVINLM